MPRIELRAGTDLTGEEAGAESVLIYEIRGVFKKYFLFGLKVFS